MNTLIKKLQLKKVKRSDFASQETHCMEAELYYNNLLVAIVSNSGHGGPDHHEVLNQVGWDQLMAECKEIADDLGHKYAGMELDSAVGELMNEWLLAADMKKLMVYKVLYLGKDDNLYQTNNAKNAAMRNAWAKQLESDDKVAIVLNNIPKARALEIFRNANRY